MDNMIYDLMFVDDEVKEHTMDKKKYSIYWPKLNYSVYATVSGGDVQIEYPAYKIEWLAGEIEQLVLAAHERGQNEYLPQGEYGISVTVMS